MSVKDLNDNNFSTETGGLAVVDFYADWCGPCKALKPLFKKISNDFSDVIFGTVDIDKSPDLAKQFNVMAIPTLVFMKDGAVFKTVVGVGSESDIIDTLNEMLESK